MTLKWWRCQLLSARQMMNLVVIKLLVQQQQEVIVRQTSSVILYMTGIKKQNIADRKIHLT